MIRNQTTEWARYLLFVIHSRWSLSKKETKFFNQFRPLFRKLDWEKRVGRWRSAGAIGARAKARATHRIGCFLCAEKVPGYSWTIGAVSGQEVNRLPLPTLFHYHLPTNSFKCFSCYFWKFHFFKLWKRLQFYPQDALHSAGRIVRFLRLTGHQHRYHPVFTG